MEEVIKKHKGPMPFAMLLTRLFNHILETNPQAIDRPARYTFHKCDMDPLDISRNPSKEKGKNVISSLIISSSSPSSDENEGPSFLEFYNELSDSEDLTKAQQEKRGMFKCLNRYVMDIDLEQPNERTPSPPPRKKSLSPPQAPSKSISSKSTHYTSSSSPKIPPPQMSPNDPYAQTMDNWPPGPSNLSPPPRVTRPPPGFPNPPPRFKPLPSTQPFSSHGSTKCTARIQGMVDPWVARLVPLG
ncbi:hypothetical protein Tco_0447915 [Tanacetum coccineum]